MSLESPELAAEVEVLRAAVEVLHRCRAAYCYSEPVQLTDGDISVFDHTVVIFRLDGHAEGATTAYAWRSADADALRVHHHVVVLPGPPSTASRVLQNFFRLSGAMENVRVDVSKETAVAVRVYHEPALGHSFDPDVEQPRTDREARPSGSHLFESDESSAAT